MKQKIKSFLGDPRYDEYQAALSFIGNVENQKIADIACGTGTFISAIQQNNEVVGVDLNPINVNYCKEIGYNVVQGNALNLSFSDESFDIVHSSHVMQVFAPNDGVRYLSELLRICKTNGKVILTTLNDFSRFYRHPENVRPYPPDAILRLCSEAEGANSPMFNISKFEIGRIWLRRDPLFKLDTSVKFKRLGFYNVINRLQYKLLLRNYVNYSAYVMEITKK
jgi:SAM-dependent methyltransferase